MSVPLEDHSVPDPKKPCARMEEPDIVAAVLVVLLVVVLHCMRTAENGGVWAGAVWGETTRGTYMQIFHIRQIDCPASSNEKPRWY